MGEGNTYGWHLAGALLGGGLLQVGKEIPMVGIWLTEAGSGYLSRP